MTPATDVNKSVFMGWADKMLTGVRFDTLTLVQEISVVMEFPANEKSGRPTLNLASEAVYYPYGTQ